MQLLESASQDDFASAHRIAARITSTRSCSKAHSLNIVKRTRDVTDAKHDSSQAVDRTLELHIEERHGHKVDI